MPDYVKSKCRIKICRVGSCIATGQHNQPRRTGKKGKTNIKKTFTLYP